MPGLAQDSSVKPEEGKNMPVFILNNPYQLYLEHH
jgi:hypothetical protein